MINLSFFSKFKPLFFSIFPLFIPILYAEIEEITITWNAFKCQNACNTLIEQKFGTIQGVQNIVIDPQSGRGVITWEKGVLLSYEPFRYASAGVGIFIDTMRIRAKGTVLREGELFFLISEGDGTRFQIVGPLHSEPGRYVPMYNLASHPLTPAMREKLMVAARDRALLIISGPLLLPSYYPLTLIPEQIK